MKPLFSTQLLRWNQRENNRPMPWKGEKDPYKIWLSEIILQQTRVEQGWAYYEKFIKNFPTIKQLAQAPDEKVFKLWEGLGYYSRCKNLLETARIIVRQHKGVFPSDYETIRSLKGIGPYTAAAIASFAFNLPYAVVDGNVQRVLARYFGITTPIDSTAGKKLFNELANALLHQKNPALYNQAIMDFGAVVCKPQSPLCESCVQRKECEAYLHNQVKQLPVKEKSIVKKERLFYYYILVLNNEQVYIRKRNEKDIWQNLHEFVLEADSEHSDIEKSARLFLTQKMAVKQFNIASVSKVYRQQLTHQHIKGNFIVIHIKKPLISPGDYWLVNTKELRQLAFPRFINQFLDQELAF